MSGEGKAGPPGSGSRGGFPMGRGRGKFPGPPGPGGDRFPGPVGPGGPPPHFPGKCIHCVLIVSYFVYGHGLSLRQELVVLYLLKFKRSCTFL